MGGTIVCHSPKRQFNFCWAGIEENLVMIINHNKLDKKKLMTIIQMLCIDDIDIIILILILIIITISMIIKMIIMIMIIIIIIKTTTIKNALCKTYIYSNLTGRPRRSSINIDF